MYSISTFKCPYCGLTMTVPRNEAKRRRKNHVKTLFCVRCQKDVDMKENRTCDFKERTMAEKEEEERR